MSKRVKAEDFIGNQYTYLDKLSIKDLLLNKSKFIIRGMNNAE